MRSQIVAAEIGFGLCDDAGGGAVDQNFAQEVARNFNGGAAVESAFEDGSDGHVRSFSFTIKFGLLKKVLAEKGAWKIDATIHGSGFTLRGCWQAGRIAGEAASDGAHSL